MTLSPTSSRASSSSSAGVVAGSAPASFVAPCDPRLAINNSLTLGANVGAGCRVVIPTTGTLHNLTIYIAASAGNLDIAVYDTAATTRNRLYSSGSVASPGTGWRTIGDPALAVTAGQQVDLCIAMSSGSCTIGRNNVTIADPITHLPTGFFAASGGGAPYLDWQRLTSLPWPSTILESSFLESLSTFFVMGYIS